MYIDSYFDVSFAMGLTDLLFAFLASLATMFEVQRFDIGTADCRTAFGRDDYRISCSSVCQLCATFGRCVVRPNLPEQVDAFLAAIHTTIAATRSVRVAAECEDRLVYLNYDWLIHSDSRESREFGIV